MNKYIQLGLFTGEFPEWENITIEWLYNYLSTLYPEMKFQFDTYIDWDGEECCQIIQTAFKKEKLTFDVGEYDNGVTWVKNRKYVGCFKIYNKCNDRSAMVETYDSWEKFNELVPLRIQCCKKSADITKHKEKTV